MATRGPEPSMSDQEILEYMQENRRPFVTSSEVAEVADVARQNAYRRLQRLYESDKIEKYQAGASAVCWWLPEDQP